MRRASRALLLVEIGQTAGVVQLVHGLGEYASRHEPLIARLVAAGYTVYADDHRGTARPASSRPAATSRKLGAPRPRRDARRRCETSCSSPRSSARENPELPLGAARTQLGVLPRAVGVERAPRELRRGHPHRHRLPHPAADERRQPQRQAPTPRPTGYEWLSRDPAVAEAALADPLVFTATDSNSSASPTACVCSADPPPAGPRPPASHPDRQRRHGGRPAQRRIARRQLSAAQRAERRRPIVYPDARHEIFNETNRDEVIADTLGWLGSGAGIPPHEFDFHPDHRQAAAGAVHLEGPARGRLSHDRAAPTRSHPRRAACQVDRWIDVGEELMAHLMSIAHKIGSAQREEWDADRDGLMIEGYMVRTSTSTSGRPGRRASSTRPASTGPPTRTPR